MLAAKWVIENKLDDYISDITNIKEPCWVYIDDRCISFDGCFDDIIDKIDSTNTILIDSLNREQIQAQTTKKVSVKIKPKFLSEMYVVKKVSIVPSEQLKLA